MPSDRDVPPQLPSRRELRDRRRRAGRGGRGTARVTGPRAWPHVVLRTTVAVGLVAGVGVSVERSAQAEPPAEAVPSARAGTPSAVAPADPQPAAPATPCSVDYSVTPTGTERFAVLLVLANTARTAVDGWDLRWRYPSAQKVLYGFNAVVTNGPAGATATGLGVNRRIPAGARVTLGFVAERGAQTPAPSDFTLNGQACRWRPAPAPAGGTVPPSPSR